MKQFLLITSLIFSLASTPLPAYSAPSGDGISKQRAVEIAQQRFPGRVLSVEKKGGRYHVKILSSDGDVRIIKVDADKKR